MKTRALIFIAALVAATAGPLLAQTPPAAPQPGAAPRGRTAPNAPQPGTAPRARTAVTPEAAPPLPPPPPAPGASRRTGQPINIKVEFTLIDQRSGGAPVKRTVSIVVADAHTGQIRSQSDVFGINGGVPLNIDTSPDLLPDGKVRVGFNLQYDWPAPLDQTASATGGNPPRGTVLKTAMHDSASLILESGKSMVAAQSADPIGDRQVTVEVKATVLR
jgi:hypothetical protein